MLVRGWRVEIQLRIPLDEPPTPPGSGLSSKDRLRSFGIDDDGVVQQSIQQRGGNDGVAEDLAPLAEPAVGGQDDGAALVAGVDELEEEVGELLSHQS